MMDEIVFSVNENRRVGFVFPTTLFALVTAGYTGLAVEEL
jgi:hypothetical protein